MQDVFIEAVVRGFEVGFIGVMAGYLVVRVFYWIYRLF